MRTDIDYERICAEMVGRSYGSIKVLEYVGMVKFSEARGRSRALRVRCEECGCEYLMEASRLRSGAYKRCPECSPHGNAHKRDTLCWDCAKSTSKYRCPWAAGRPRSDWEAEKTLIHQELKGKGHPTESYRVISCPAFEEGRP